jgi:hypothetical protein
LRHFVFLELEVEVGVGVGVEIGPSLLILSFLSSGRDGFIGDDIGEGMTVLRVLM